MYALAPRLVTRSSDTHEWVVGTRTCSITPRALPTPELTGFRQRHRAVQQAAPVISIVSLVIASLIDTAESGSAARDASRSPWTQAFHAALESAWNGFNRVSVLAAGSVRHRHVARDARWNLSCSRLGLAVRQRSTAAPDGDTVVVPSFRTGFPRCLAIALGLYHRLRHVVEMNPQGGWDASIGIARFLLHTATWKPRSRRFGRRYMNIRLPSSAVARMDICGFSWPIAHRHALRLAVDWRCHAFDTCAARGASAGLLAGLVPLASPAFRVRPREYADAPLAFFFSPPRALIVQDVRTPFCRSPGSLPFGSLTKTKVRFGVALAAALS
jgi:hypothetical protein